MNEGFSLAFGPIILSESILLSFLVTVLLVFIGYLATRKGPESALHTAAEAALELVEQAVTDVLPKDKVRMVFPFVATLWLFVLCANLIGLIPGLSSPTRDLSITSALAITVFVAVHVYGIRAAGLKNVACQELSADRQNT